MKHHSLTHEFVEYIPEMLQEGTLYVSIRFTTVAHKCACGCRQEVITPLSRTDWQLTFDGESITLYPSIANWSFECKSHYWIRRNTITWARRWSQEEIAAGRSHNQLAKQEYLETPAEPVGHGKKTRTGKSRRKPRKKR